MKKKLYTLPPKKEDLEYLKDLTDFQIVVLCEMELLKKNKKYSYSQNKTSSSGVDGPNPKQLLFDFINDWKEKEFQNISFSRMSNFQIDIQKILPFLWVVFGDMADKNHLEVFKNNLEEQELNEISLIFSKLDKMWEKDFKEYNSVDYYGKKFKVKWNEKKGDYDELK